MPAASPAIHIEHMTKIYANRLMAVNDLNPLVPRSCIFRLFGPNGVRKRSTVRLLLGLHRPTAGWAMSGGESSGKFPSPA